MEYTSSKLIEQNGQLTDVEEDVMLACVGHIRGKMLADYTMPVW